VRAPAEQMVERLTEHIRPLAMTAVLYRQAMRRCAERGERSGAIFDALHLVAAEASQSEALITLNPADFERLAAKHGPRIIVPPDPPQITAG